MLVFAGTIKQPLPFDEAQGQPLLLDINSGYLAVLTSKAVVRVFKLVGSEAKPHAGPGELSTHLLFCQQSISCSLTISCLTHFPTAV